MAGRYRKVYIGLFRYVNKRRHPQISLTEFSGHRKFLLWNWKYANLHHGNDNAYRVHAAESLDGDCCEQLCSKYRSLRWRRGCCSNHPRNRERMDMHHYCNHRPNQRSSCDTECEAVWPTVGTGNGEENGEVTASSRITLRTANRRFYRIALALDS